MARVTQATLEGGLPAGGGKRRQAPPIVGRRERRVSGDAVVETCDPRSRGSRKERDGCSQRALASLPTHLQQGLLSIAHGACRANRAAQRTKMRRQNLHVLGMCCRHAGQAAGPELALIDMTGSSLSLLHLVRQQTAASIYLNAVKQVLGSLQSLTAARKRARPLCPPQPVSRPLCNPAVRGGPSGQVPHR